MSRKMVPYDGNSAVAHVAHATNEVIAIYPITPSSGMGEIADEKSSRGEKNIWNTIPHVVELQSEGGASGSIHGALSAGALASTFTASQGLLLMIPNMYKIAGELLSTVFHVASRSIACQALSIFGDHSDVMATRSTGYGFICSANIQESMDFALISQAATLESRVPFVHFFEGFRGSHEIQKVEELTFDDMKAMIDDRLVIENRLRGMSPEKPLLRGTSQNPDVYFQGRESVNKYYIECPGIVQKAMDRFAEITGRQYSLFDYTGVPDAEYIIVIMGSGAETVEETAEYLNGKGAKFGVLKVRLYRPFDSAALVKAIPETVKKIAVLDRTKEPGSLGEPLYLDVRNAVGEEIEKGGSKFKEYPVIVGGRYGLGSKEFTPGMVKGIFDNLAGGNPKNHFTIGIEDDVTNTSLEYDSCFSPESTAYAAKFYGLGSDGTVGANKNSIKIIAEQTDNYTQGYFEYDSKKAGATTVSHLRFGKDPIKSRYLVYDADFVACHNFTFLEKFDMLDGIKEGGTFLLNAPFGKEEIWDNLPVEVQQTLIDKKVKFYIIDAIKIAEEIGLGARINVIMQTAFFKISKVIDETVAIQSIRDAIKKTYGKKGEKIVEMNNKAVDAALENIIEIEIPDKATSKIKKPPVVQEDAPDFVKEVTAMIMSKQGDKVKVSQMPADGCWPTATTQYEKRNIAVNIPEWNPETCIQCGRCSLVCPHAAIRMKIYDASHLENAPGTFKSTEAKGKDFEGMKFTLQVAPEDCTGCGTCVFSCPAGEKEAIKMVPQMPLRKPESENFRFFLSLPETDKKLFKQDTMKGSQLMRPLFEFSGACAGCGETAYVKLLTQLFGDRAIIANATGCSSIYGGNLPTTPYSVREDGRGPAWNNSLFEDCAEIAMGMRLTVDKLTEYAGELADKLISGSKNIKLVDLLKEIRGADQSDFLKIDEQRNRITDLKKLLKEDKTAEGDALLSTADYLAKKSVWGVGGDGWAYDIGYGGLDHVLASGKNVNLLVLDTEVYSNTGGQSSKATPLGGVAKFAASGKPTPKKDLGMIAMTYGYIYVASISIGANPAHAVKAMYEAESYNGPSLVICYSHCIAHGINMTAGLGEQKNAVDCGYWPLYKFNPDLVKQGKNPLQLASKEPKIKVEEYAYNENRYKVLTKTKPERAKQLMEQAQERVSSRYALYKQLSELDCSNK